MTNEIMLVPLLRWFEMGQLELRQPVEISRFPASNYHSFDCPKEAKHVFLTISLAIGAT